MTITDRVNWTYRNGTEDEKLYLVYWLMYKNELLTYEGGNELLEFINGFSHMKFFSFVKDMFSNQFSLLYEMNNDENILDNSEKKKLYIENISKIFDQYGIE